jgi:hypothetical protein
MNTDEKLIEPRPERRHERRQRVLKGALVIFCEHTQVFDCLVRNLSTDGAKLELESTVGIPSEFELLLHGEARIAPARAVWRTEKDLGINFTGPWRPYTRTG